MQGYTRRKSRSQAQQEIQWGQRRFDGAQNSDTIASKIGDYDVARSINTVHTASDIQGHWGRKLLSPEATPGTGRLHQVAQHPKTGRWLVHRGNKLWLSTGRDGTGWTEVTSIGPDGSLEATGAFTTGNVDLSGAIATSLSGMVLNGLAPSTEVYIEYQNDIGAGLYVVDVYTDSTKDVKLAFGNTLNSNPLPASFSLVAVGSSGVTGSVTAEVDPDTFNNGTGTVVAYELEFTFRGLTLENTDGWDLWWKLVVTDGTATLTLYKDVAMTEAVAQAAGFNPGSASSISFTPLSGSGLSGTAAWPIGSYPDGTYAGTEIIFTVPAISIDADSTISPYGDTGFIVFSRGGDHHNIYVDQTLEFYWFLSTTFGYGPSLISSGSSNTYTYRYLYTFSRIVDAATQLPAYSSDRNGAILKLEGPSNRNGSDVDYLSFSSSAPISGSNTAEIPLANGSSVPVGFYAASYITHISIYRTLDVGVNGIGINGAANNSELYGWIADVPIYSTEYTDTTDDTTLRNNLVGASTEQDSLALRSRLFREMARGIGAIGPDFMVTAEPQGQQASYCDIAFNPRLIGFNFPGTQRFILQDPISEIYRTKDLFVFLCPSSTYTSISSIQSETGIAGLIPIATIQNFDPASRTIGIKYGQGVFTVDESSFITLCTDGTVRIFSGSSWGDPIDSLRVHNITSQIDVGAVFSFFRGVMLLWGRTAGPTTLSGGGAAVLSDLSVTGFGGDFLYGRVESVGGGDAYTVTLYSDSERTVPVASGASGLSPVDPQTITLSAADDSGISGSVYAAPFGTLLPADFTVDFRQIADTCLRYAQGGSAGSQWTEISRPYWAYPGPWCGAMLVEDDSAALRVAVFDAFDNSVFAVEDSLPLRQFEDDTVTAYPAGPLGDITEYISAMSLTGAVTVPSSYDVVISGITPDTFGVYIVSGVTTLAQYEGPISGQPLINAALTAVDGSGISGTFSISGFSGGYVYGSVNIGGVLVSGTAPIPSLLRLRELTGAQENYKCFHEESHIAFRPRYGQSDLPAGMLLTVRGYADGALVPGAETTSPPANSDIQFFAPVQGDRIQIEYETNKSGWRITSMDTKYQSQDMQAQDGPWNGQEAVYQEALGADLLSWLYGSSRLVDRASPRNASYPGAIPDEITGPSGTFYGQYFGAPVERALDSTLQDYTLMLWVLGPTIGGARAVQAADGLYVAFPAAGYIDVGGMGAAVSPEVYAGNGWQHFAVVRAGLVRTIYHNGVAIASEDVDGATLDAAVMTVGSAEGPEPLCDIRLYGVALDAPTLWYYYNDVATNGGNKVLP